MPSPFLRSLPIALLVLAAAVPVSAGEAVSGSWVTQGPEGGPVFALASPPDNPQVVYAGVVGGAYKSLDGGTSWRWAGLGLDLRSPVATFAIDPLHTSTLYAGQNPGLFKSVDGGATWRQTGLPPYLQVAKIAIHPRSPQTLFAATNGGLYQSANGGARWKRITRGLVPAPYGAVTVAIDPTSPSRMFLAINPRDQESTHLYDSLDGGVSWHPVENALLSNHFIGSLALNPRTPKTVYATTEIGILKSIDAGRTWTQPNPGFTAVFSLAFHPTQKNTLYAAASGGVFCSLDSGATWSPISQGLPPELLITSLVVSTTKTPTLLAAADDPTHESGVYKSTDAGTSWTLSNRGLTASGINSIALVEHEPSTVWAVSNYSLFKSLNRGQTWSQVFPEPLPPVTAYARWVVTSPVDPETVYLGRYDGQIVRSRDGGETWTVAGNPSSNTTVLMADPQDPLTLWATGIPGGVFKSTDGGETWITLPGLAANLFCQGLAISPSTPSTVYAASLDATLRLLRSTDAGATWTLAQEGLPAGVTILSIDPHHSETVYAASGGDIYQTIDGGATWALASTAFHNQTIQWLTSFDSGYLYAAVRYGSVYESDDGGQSWALLGDIPRSGSFSALAAGPFDACYVYVATYNRGLLLFNRTGIPYCP